MIYFIVNNNFHLIDAENHLEEFHNEATALIKIPHALSIPPKHKFDQEFEFPQLIKRLKDHFRLLRIFRLHKKVRQQLKNVSDNDTLIFYTEFEYLTHYIIRYFKKKKAKVILIEEGLLTYETFISVPDPSALTVKKKLLRYYLWYIMGYPTTRIAPMNGMFVPQILDNQIDKLLTYKHISPYRSVPTGLLNSEYLHFDNLHDNTVLFLNEPMYEGYVTMEEFSRILHDVLTHLSNSFEYIHFKFHPRENEDHKKQIIQITNQYPKVAIVTAHKPAELIIGEICAKYIVSFIAHTLLYLAKSNCVCVYTVHFYPEFLKYPPLALVQTLLKGMNYQKIQNWADIKSDGIGFQDNNTHKALSLKKHIEKMRSND